MLEQEIVFNLRKCFHYKTIYSAQQDLLHEMFYTEYALLRKTHFHLDSNSNIGAPVNETDLNKERLLSRCFI